MMIIGVVIAIRDDIMKVLVLPRAHGLEAEVVDDEQIRLGQSRQFALVRAHRPRRGELTQELSMGGEHYVVASTYGDVAQCLGKVALTGAAGADDEQCQEVGVGELLLHGLRVAYLQEVQDAGEAELFQMRRELGDGIHGCILQLSSSVLREMRDVPL